MEIDRLKWSIDQLSGKCPYDGTFRSSTIKEGLLVTMRILKGLLSAIADDSELINRIEL